MSKGGVIRLLHTTWLRTTRPVTLLTSIVICLTAAGAVYFLVRPHPSRAISSGTQTQTWSAAGCSTGGGFSGCSSGNWNLSNVTDRSFVYLAPTSQSWANDSGVPTTNNLRSVWAASSNNVWAVGYNGTILHGDGFTWTTVPVSTGADFMSISGYAANDIWAVGSQATVLHYNGTSWSTISTSPSSPFTYTSVSATGSGSFIAVADDNYLYQGTIYATGGTTISKVTQNGGSTPCYNPSPLDAVWGSSPSNWAVGSSGAGTFYNGSCTNSTIGGGTLQAIHGSGLSDIWTGDNTGNLFHYNGTQWLSVASNTTNPINSIWATGSSFAWVVADHSILDWNGSQWAVMSNDNPASTTLHGVWAPTFSGAGDNGANTWAYAVGDSGKIVRYGDNYQSSGYGWDNFDATTTSSWVKLTKSDGVLSGQSLTYYAASSGSTACPTPGGNWSGWTQLAFSGSDADLSGLPSSRYLCLGFEMATGNSRITPTISWLELTYNIPAVWSSPVSGHVYTQGTTTGVAGATVELDQYVNNSWQQNVVQPVVTASDGAWSLPYTDGNQYRVVVTPPAGYVAGTTPPYTPNCTPSSTTSLSATWQTGYLLPAGGCGGNAFYLLVQNGTPTLAGHVYQYGTTTGVGGATVTLKSYSSSTGTWTAVSGGSVTTAASGGDPGAWSLTYPFTAPQTEYEAVVDLGTSGFNAYSQSAASANCPVSSSTASSLVWQSPNYLPAAGCAGNNFYLTNSRLVSGSVLVDPSQPSANSPVAGAQVILSDLDAQTTANALTGTDGKWSISYVPGRRYTATITGQFGSYNGTSYTVAGPTVAVAGCPASSTTASQLSWTGSSLLPTGSDCSNNTFYVSDQLPPPCVGDIPLPSHNQLGQPSPSPSSSP